MNKTIKRFSSIKENYMSDGSEEVLLRSIFDDFMKNGKPSYIDGSDDEFDMDYRANLNGKKYILNIIGTPGGKVVGIYCDSIGGNTAIELEGEEKCKVFLGNSYQEVIKKIYSYLQ